MTTRLLLIVWGLIVAAPAAAQVQEPAPQNPADEPVVYEEQVVVTATKAEQQLVNAPATVSVVGEEMIQNSPATNIGDLLRSVPGQIGRAHV